MVRLAWGGGSEKIWEGSIALDRGTLSQPRLLGIEADEPGSMWLADGRLMVRQRSPRAYDGVDLLVTAPADAKLIVKLASGDAQPAIEIPLADLAADFRNRELDKDGNHLLVRRAPGDELVFRTTRDSFVFAPGEALHAEIVPHGLPWSADAAAQLQMQLLDTNQHSVWSSTAELHGNDPIPVDLTVPQDEGVYDLVISAQQKTSWQRPWRNSMQWKRPTIERRVQLIVIAHMPQPKGNIEKPHQVFELDPTAARGWDAVKLPQWRRFSRGVPSPLGNGTRETVHLTVGDASQLKPNAADVSWEAYPLGVSGSGRPHAVEIDYPGNVQQTLGISIVETNSAGALVPIGIDSGIEVSEEAASLAAPEWQHHRLVFWPRTSSPLLLITNRSQQLSAVYGKIRVLACGDRLGEPEALASGRTARRLGGPANSSRSLVAYLDRPLLPDNFSAQVLDTWSGRTLHDWRTFHQAGTRLVDYLRYAGYDALMLAVAADGSAIYPSQVLEPTARYDMGVFFASGQDPRPKDVLELLLRLMDREELQLIPSLEFASPLPALEAIRRRGGQEAAGLEWVGPDGKTWCETYATRRGLAPYYNLLDPRVQDAMLAAVHELAARYAGHASFSGLALRLSAYGYAQLPGVAWGMDDATIAHFEADTGQKVPGEGRARFAARAAFLLEDENRPQWLAWRAAVCRKFYHRVQETLAASRRDMPLYLAGTEMLAGPDIESELRSGLLRQMPFSTALLQAGIDPALYRDDGKIILLRSERIVPNSPVMARAAELQLSESPEADAFFRGLPQSGSLFFHPPQELRVPSFDARVAVKPSDTLLLSEIVPSGMENRRRFAESLAANDAQTIIDGGWLLPMGQEEATRHFAAGYRSLPRCHFADAEETRAGQPVVVRWATERGKTFAYAVNTTPFAVTATTRIQASPNCTLEDLAGGGSGQLKSDDDGLSWNVAIEPYDMAAVSFSEPDAKLSHAHATLPESAAQWIAGRIRSLGARAVVLRAPPSLDVLDNANFQAKPTATEPVPGWAISKHGGISIGIDAVEGHAADETSAGRRGVAANPQSVKISSQGPVACLVSRPFTPPPTGRLAMSVWLKVSDSARQPNLRLAVEAKVAGRDYYRFAPIGQPASPDERGWPIGTTWRRFIVPFNDLPCADATLMRVRLDLMGAGELWVDDVELFDLAFNESELRAVYKLLALADEALQNGEMGESLKLLHGYWPRFLEENVPLPPATVAAKPSAEQASRDNSAAPAQSPGWSDRVKGMLPEKWR